MATFPVERTLIIANRAEESLSKGRREGTLTVLSGPGSGDVQVLRSPRAVIGRGEGADLRIEDAAVSRTHACIWRAGHRFEIEDLGSSNGTFLEHGRITKRTELRDGARIGIGNSVLRFAMQDELEQDASRRLYHMSVRDGLTGLYNRHHFDERLAAEVAFATRHATALALMLIDVDHFKQINDRFGHQAGDAVLQQMGDTLQRCVRTEDIVARYGGEEFAVIARGIDALGARSFAERIRMLIGGSSVIHEGTSIAVSASIGVAHSDNIGVSGKTNAFLAAADHALYAAKHAGRNRVVLAQRPDSNKPASAQRSSRAERLARSWEQPTMPSNTKEPHR
jgi:diguanylate cyclase (GGDEF)-like protein